MEITTLATIVVLFAALAHACWNAMLKLGDDPVLNMAMVSTVMALVTLPGVLALALPDPASWPYLAASALIHQLYFLLLALSYREGDLSYVYPLSRGIAPVLIAGLALAVAGERLSPTATAGVLIVTLGIGSLAFASHGGREAGRGAGKWPTILALMNGCTIAAYSVADGTGVRLSGDPLAYISWVLFASAAPFALTVLAWRRRAMLATLRQQWRPGLSAGTLAAGAYGAAIWAMGVLPMAMVSALRESSVLIATIIGVTVLKEPLGPRRIAAAALVVGGLLLLKLFG